MVAAPLPSSSPPPPVSTSPSPSLGYCSSDRCSSESGSESAATPWLGAAWGGRYRRAASPQPLAKEQQGAALGEEVADFAALMGLTGEERAARDMLRCSLQSAAQQHWGHATVKVYGSFACGLSLPGSDLDIIIEGCHCITGRFSVFTEFLQKNGYDILANMQTDADAVLKMRSRQSGLVANVFATAGRSHVRQHAGLARRLLARFPAAGPVALVVRTVLAHCNLGATSGGLSSFAVLLMVLHCFLARYEEEEARAKDPGDALRDFLRYYADEFDFERYSVCVDADGGHSPTARERGGAGVSVCDPREPGNNVAESCAKLGRVRAVLRSCLAGLEGWDRGAGRGATPLSAVLPPRALKALWARKEQVDAQAAALWERKEVADLDAPPRGAAPHAE